MNLAATHQEFAGPLHCLWISVLIGIAAPVSASSNELPLNEVMDVPLTGATTRLDYESLDPRNGRLFIAHLGDSMVTVFDTKTNRIIKDIDDIGHVHGVLVVPELDRVYASATKTDELVSIDERTLQITSRIAAGYYPDGMAYAPKVHKLFVSDENGDTETIIDAATNRRLATLPLGGDVGNTQYDPVSGHIFVNVQTHDDLVEIDPGSDGIIARYPLPGAKGNHGLLIVPEAHLAFIACEDNAKLLVFDMQRKQVTASFDVGANPDVLAFDPGLHRLYVAGEKGIVSVFKEGKNGVEKLGEGFLGGNAHVVAVDPKSHRVFFPLKDVDGHPTLRIMIPGTL